MTLTTTVDDCLTLSWRNLEVLRATRTPETFYPPPCWCNFILLNGAVCNLAHTLVQSLKYRRLQWVGLVPHIHVTEMYKNFGLRNPLFKVHLKDTQGKGVGSININFKGLHFKNCGWLNWLSVFSNVVFHCQKIIIFTSNSGIVTYKIYLSCTKLFFIFCIVIYTSAL